MNESGVARLKVAGLTKRFGSFQAVSSVDLTVGVGRIMGLVGANGAGKSTLIRVLAGVFTPDSGTIELDGEELHLRSPRAALQHGIAVIHQELHLVGTQTVAENLFMGESRPRRLGVLDWRSTYRQARAVFGRLGIEIDVAKPVDEATLWERWATTIARAVMHERKLLVLDEPTAAMDPDGVEKVFAAVRAARAEGCSVIFVSHRLDEVMGLCDRVHVMRNGGSVADLPIEEVSEPRLIDLIVGDAATIRERAPHREAAAASDEQGLIVRGLTVGTRADQVSFEVRPGEIVGLAGLVGSGRSTVLRALAGYEKASGEVVLGGRPIRLGSPAAARAHRVGIVPEDRLAQGLIEGFSVASNIAFGSTARDRPFRRWLISYRREADTARRWISQLAIRGATPHGGILSLSGGNQQKALFARVLERRPRLLLLDEPTRGVDVGAKAELLSLVTESARDGVCCVVSLSDIEELVAIADRVIVLREGRVVRDLAPAQSDAKTILEACYDRC